MKDLYDAIERLENAAKAGPAIGLRVLLTRSEGIHILVETIIKLIPITRSRMPLRPLASRIESRRLFDFGKNAMNSMKNNSDRTLSYEHLSRCGRFLLQTLLPRLAQNKRGSLFRRTPFEMVFAFSIIQLLSNSNKSCAKFSKIIHPHIK